MSRRANITKIILGTIEAIGLISTAMLVPSVLVAISKTQKQRTQYRQKYYISQTVRTLVEKGLIEFHKNNQGTKYLRLTNKGKEELKGYALQDLIIKKPWRWDKKYRIIIFDIKEFKRGTRDKLRRWLEHLGFIRLQNSVWVYPYECREVIILLKSHFKIGKEVLYMTVDSIENDKWLKKEFGLDI